MRFGQSSLAALKVQAALPQDQREIKCQGRSMGMLCQRFLMMFDDVTNNRMVSLDAASVDIMDVNGRSNLTKTKAKRLYDIANILSSIGLITKVFNPPSNMRKPVYKWVGKFELSSSSPSSSPPPTTPLAKPTTSDATLLKSPMLHYSGAAHELVATPSGATVEFSHSGSPPELQQPSKRRVDSTRKDCSVKRPRGLIPTEIIPSEMSPKTKSTRRMTTSAGVVNGRQLAQFLTPSPVRFPGTAGNNGELQPSRLFLP